MFYLFQLYHIMKLSSPAFVYVKQSSVTLKRESRLYTPLFILSSLRKSSVLAIRSALATDLKESDRPTYCLSVTCGFLLLLRQGLLL